MGIFDFDPEKMNQESADASNKKDWLNVANSAANNILSAPSAAEIMLNQKRAPVNVGLDKIADNVKDPWEKQKKTYEMYKAAKEGQALEAETDPNSRDAMALRGLLVSKQGLKPEDVEGLTKKQMTELYGNPGKLAEIKAQAQVNFENDMAKQKATQEFQAGENAKNRANSMAEKKLGLESENKNLPQNIYQAATFGKRLEDANSQMDQILGRGYDPTSKVTAGINKMSPEWMKSEDAKLMDQAQRNFLNAVLRRESGSAISPSEFESGNMQYFPVVGDTPAVLAQKKRNRDVALAGLKTEGAKAWNKMEGNLGAATAAHGNPSSINQAGAKGGKPKTVIQNGHTYTLNPQTGEYE